MKENGKVIDSAATLSCIEIGLGSALHGLHLPLSGQILSLNQAFLLSRHAIKNKHMPRFAPLEISTISALLKSLSPTGKKLTPMMAIGTQGLLFNLGTFCFGNNALGLILGNLLLCLWAYIQPLLIYYLFFGKNLIYMGEYYLKKINRVVSVQENDLILMLGIFISLKVMISFGLLLLNYRISDKTFNIYKRRFSMKFKKKTDQYSPFRGAVKDMLSPLFLCSIILLAIFFYYSQTPVNLLVLGILRPLAACFLLFFMLRKFGINKAITLLKKLRLHSLARGLESTYRQIS